jgi:hypothetical protein
MSRLLFAIIGGGSILNRIHRGLDWPAGQMEQYLLYYSRRTMSLQIPLIKTTSLQILVLHFLTGTLPTAKDGEQVGNIIHVHVRVNVLPVGNTNTFGAKITRF